MLLSTPTQDKLHLCTRKESRGRHNDCIFLKNRLFSAVVVVQLSAQTADGVAGFE